MSVRELFRRKLEYATVIPDCTVNTKLMRKVARKEFVRFNPLRFNVYYLGGILLAALTAGILIHSAVGKSENKLPPVINQDTAASPANTGYIDIPQATIINKSPEKLPASLIVSGKTSLKHDLKPAPENDAVPEALLTEHNINVPVIDNSSLTKKNLFSESSPDSKTLKTEQKNDNVLFEPSSESGCSPLKVHFYNKVNSSDSCNWSFGDGGFSDKKNPDWIFDMDGEYNVVLRVYDQNGLKESYSTVITVYPRPHALFEISPEKAVIPDDEIRFINYSTDGMHFKWDFGDGTASDLFEPKHSYLKYSKYSVSLIVTSEFGCSDSLTVANAFSGSEYFIDFPNAFIPNPGGPSGGFYSAKSDEATQVFHPNYSGVSEYQLKIFSKLGILIFESTDVNIGWDGYFKGQLSNPGVYIWKVRGSFRNGESFIKMGDVTLLGH